jgi:RNA polymerase sigma factor FliA
MISMQQWRDYKTTRDTALRERIVTEFAPFTRYVVGRIGIRTATLGEEDLLGQALVGLLEAVDRFDPEQGVKFETFAYYRIRGAILDMVRKMDLLPQSARENQARLEAACEQLLGELGRQPTEEELCARLELSPEQLAAWLRDSHTQTVLSLDLPVADEEGAAVSMADAISDPGDRPDERVIHGEERDRLAVAIDELPEAERHVISLYYHEGLTMKEIGQVLSVTESRICQIHAKAISRLRAAMAAEERIPSCPSPRS